MLLWTKFFIHDNFHHCTDGDDDDVSLTVTHDDDVGLTSKQRGLTIYG